MDVGNNKPYHFGPSPIPIKKSAAVCGRSVYNDPKDTIFCIVNEMIELH